jgi:hypothetical protein
LTVYRSGQGREEIEWHLVPRGGQHFNGQAERIIGILKRQIHRRFEGKKYTHEEMCTILQEAAQTVNSYPLMASPWAEKEPFSPEGLMLRRATVGLPTDKFETGLQLVKRFRLVQEV